MNKIALLISSGDMSSKWIPYTMYYYNKNWNCDEIIDTVFLFETIVPNIKTDKKNVFVEKTGKVSWGQGMIEYLKRCPYKYIILFHEDYFLTKPSNKEQLLSLINIMDENNMQLLKICGEWSGWTASPKIDIPELTKKENIKLYGQDVGYITSHMPSIWNVEYLLKTLLPNENPWQHELNGYHRAKALNIPVHTFVGEAPIPYSESVTAGKPRPSCEHLFDIEVEKL
jgi:hypothetical protein